MVQSTGQFAVLMVLATYARNNGSCWCTVEQLMEHTRLARRGVQKILRQLEDSGQIEVLTNLHGGRGKATRYRMQLPEQEIKEETEPARSTQSKGGTRFPVSEETKNVKSPKNGRTQCAVYGDKGRSECAVSENQKGALSAPDISSQIKISEYTEGTHTLPSLAANRRNVQSLKDVKTPKERLTPLPSFPETGTTQSGKNVQAGRSTGNSPHPNPSPPLDAGAPRQRDAMPSLPELIDYCAKEQLPKSDAKWLFDHWLANGFTLNNQPIKDWQAVIRCWKRDAYLPSRKNPAKSKSEEYKL
jgi:hypothetical protein